MCGKWRADKPGTRHMPRRLVFASLVTAVLISLLMTGCASGRLHATINRDGSADLVSRVLFDPNLIALIGEDRLLAYMQIQIEEQGFMVRRISEDDQIGIEASRHLKRAEELLMLIQPTMDSPLFGSLVVERRLFWTDYTLDATLNLSQLPIGPDLIPDILLPALFRQVKLDVALTLPIRPVRHNADSALDDGKMLLWNLRPDQPNQLYMQARVPNLRNLVGLTVLLAILLTFVLLVVRRSKQSI